MLVVAVIGLLINLLVFWILTRGEREHINVRGAALHVLGDLLGSIAAIAAAIIIFHIGWMPIDPILSVLVSLLILRSAWSLLRSSLHILLEGAPENATPDEIEAYLKKSIPGLADVRHVHVWLITSGKALATLHVRPRADVDPRVPVQNVEAELIKRFDIEHSTIAVDWPERSTDNCCLGTNPAADRQGHDRAHHDHGHAGHAH
jgi:cobalt-zinc-cadmium efflux system protein